MKFDLINPTRIVFGKGSIASLSELVPESGRVLLLFGGGSIRRNGVHDAVMAALGRREVVAFGGIEPNPHYETIMKAAALARDGRSDLILGVGGGSVIDAAKFLAYAATSGSEDPWDDLMAGRLPVETLPVGAVLTLPATGSESNPVSVITHAGRRLKYPFSNVAARPAFAVLDPDTMKSLGGRYLANGAVDAFTHVLEQYLTVPQNAPIQYGYAETLLQVLKDWGPELLEKNSEAARENVMWAANQALNGLIGAGIRQDWSTHYIGHAITAIYGTDHARTLTMVMPSLLRFKLDDKVEMLARYARRVWHVDEADDRLAAERAITLTEDFFFRMGLPVRTGDPAVDPDRIVEHMRHAGQTRLGENGDIGPTEVRAILAGAA